MVVICSSLVADAIVASTVLALLYYLATRNSNYWEKRGVRSIRSWPFLGSLPSVLFLRDNISTALHRKYKQMSREPFFGINFMGVPSLVINDLDLVKNVLVKDAHVFLDRTFSLEEDVDPLMAKNLAGLRGRKWRHVRVKLSPTFTSGKMRKMFYLVDECGKQLASCLEKEPTSGGIVNVKEMMGRYTTDVIASCAFGVDANALADSKSEFFSIMKKVFARNRFAKKFVSSLAFIVPALAKFFKLKYVDDDVCDYVRRMFWDMVDERKKTGVIRKDFMDLMIKLIDDGEVGIEDTKDLLEINQDYSPTIAENSKKDNIDFKLKGDDFVAQAFVFLIAGFETSSAALTFALYELALNPGVQEKLRNEINTVLHKNGGKVSYDVIAEMSYLDMVVSESLRKYPPVGWLDRVCLSEYKIPGTEVTIEKGITVIISVHGLHTDPEIYPDPEKFDPERFSPENKAKRSHYAYLPFGEGPRICIALRFALMQVKTALIHILTTYRVCRCAQTPTPPLRYKADVFGLESQEDIVVAFKRLK